MIFYYPASEYRISHFKVESVSMELMIVVPEWFPNTKQKLTLLLKVMKEYSTPAELSEMLDNLMMDLNNKDTFAGRNNSKKPTFINMLARNKKQISIFNGLYGEDYRHDA